MPVFFVATEIQEAAADHVINNASKLVAVVAPTKADTFAEFQAKVVGEAAVAPADFFKNYEGAGSADLRLTCNAKSGIDNSAPAAGVDDLCVAVIDETNEIVLVCQDATDRVITDEAGDTITIPGINVLVPDLVAEA